MATTKIITEVTDLNAASSTSGLKMPTGGAYSGTPTDGMVRNNTTGSSQGSASTMQHYNGTEWKNYENTPLTPVSFTADYLVVAGGGGGSRYGGGGAGGLRTSYGSTSGGGSPAESSLTLQKATNYTVTIGPGGTGGNRAAGSQGSDSTFSTITSNGGGEGKSPYSPNVINGGSGGGGDAGVGGGTGTSGQGFNGGPAGLNGPSDYKGTGGGGAAQAGQTYNGGNGLAVSITGSSVTYAGGGGGSYYVGASGASGGSGGGGNGTGWNSGVSPEVPNGTNGTYNLGGGGGGAMSGGSGIVILRYPTADVSSYAVTGTLDTVADTAYPVANKAYYKLNGDALDSSGNGYNGTASNITYATGRFGEAAVFNGTNSSINLGATNQFASNQVSISFWVKPVSVTTSQVLFGNGNGGSFADGDNDIFLRSDGYIGYELGQSSSVYEAKYSTTTKLIANTWSHIALTYDSSLGTNITKVYVNGVQQSLSPTYAAGGTFSGNIFIGTLDYNIGKRNLAGLLLNGSIDQVRIFNSLISAANVTALYNEGTVLESTDGTDSILQFIGGSGTVTFS